MCTASPGERVGQAPKKKGPEHRHTKSTGVTELRLFPSGSRWKMGEEVFGWVGSGESGGRSMGMGRLGPG